MYRFFVCALLCFCAYSIRAQIVFQPFQAISAGPGKVVSIGDVNNDGRNDAVVGNGYSFGASNNYRLLVYLQHAAGMLSSTPLTYSYTPANNLMIKAIAIADVNNDGRNDVISGYADSISICYQDAAGGLSAPVRYYSGSSVDGLRAGDLNNDGKADIVVSHASSQFIRVFYQGASGFSSATFSTPLSSGTHEVEVADANGDSKPDVVLLAGSISGMNSGGIAIYTQTAGGSLNPYTVYYPPSASVPGFNMLYGLAVGDLNNDGRIDVAAATPANSPTARIVLWYQDTTTHLLLPATTLSAYDIPEPLEIADLDCDGKPEIIAVHGGWMRLTVYAQSSGTYSAYTGFSLPYSSHYSPYGVSVGDITGDGRKDVAVADDNNGLILLQNITAPPVITSSSTVTHADTFYAYTTTSQTFIFARNFTDTSGPYTIHHIDTIQVTYRFRTDSVKNDTITIRSGIICSGSVTDTIIRTGLHAYHTNINDTLLLGASADSVHTGLRSVSTIALNIYPNPTARFLVVSGIQAIAEHKELRIALFNYTGQRINAAIAHKGTYLSADLKDYPPGIYFIQIEAAGNRYYGKVVKE